MARFYNQSRSVRLQLARLDPDFWELRVDQLVLDRFPSNRMPHFETEEEVRQRLDRNEWVARMMGVIRKLMEEILTERQREVVRLYFLEERTEREIADELDITVSSVSQHLFGKRRGGRIVGGAIPKLRKHLERVRGLKI